MKIKTKFLQKAGLLNKGAFALLAGTFFVSSVNAEAFPGTTCPTYTQSEVASYYPSIEKIRKTLVDSMHTSYNAEEVAKKVDKLIDPSLTKKNDKGEVISVSNGKKLDFNSPLFIYPAYQDVFYLAKQYLAKPDPFLLKVITTSLKTLQNKYYYVGAPELGNWWTYEIGVPKALGQTVIALSNVLSFEEQKSLVAPIAYFQPNPYLSAVASGAVYSSSPHLRLSTGGNRLDTALVSFYRGVVEKNPSQIQCALNSINDTVTIVDVGDGFHKDGTFIQHDVIGYNGTYGQVLLDGFAIMKKQTAGTKFKFGNPEVFKLFNSFKDSYGYLMINGGITDAVSGRAVYKYNSYYDKDYDPVKTRYNRKDTSSDLNRGRSLSRIFNDLELNIPERKDNKYFYAMDKLVHRNANGGAIVLSMHSARIANFEAINGDNPFGQHTGDGMTYIYGKNPYANVSYFIDYNPYFAPGTTEIKDTLVPFAGERRFANDLSPLSFVGAVSSSNNQQFVAFEYTNWTNKLQGFKSYVFDDKGMYSTGLIKNWGGKKPYTTIDQRRLDTAEIKNSQEPTNFDKYKSEGLTDAEAHAKANLDREKAFPNPKAQVFVDGKAVTKTTHYSQAPKEVVFTDKYGTKITYALWDIPNLDIVFENGFVRFVTTNSTKFAYGVYPQSNAPKNNPYKVKVLSDTEHVIYSPDQDRYYMNFFSIAPHSYAGVSTETGIQVVKYFEDGSLVLELNDPTQELLLPTKISVDGAYSLKSSTSTVKSLKSSNGKTSFYVDLTTHGESVKVVLKPIK